MLIDRIQLKKRIVAVFLTSGRSPLVEYLSVGAADIFPFVGSVIDGRR